VESFLLLAAVYRGGYGTGESPALILVSASNGDVLGRRCLRWKRCSGSVSPWLGCGALAWASSASSSPLCFASRGQAKSCCSFATMVDLSFRDVRGSGEVSVIVVLRWCGRFSLPRIVLGITHLVMVLMFEAKRRCSGLLGGTLPFGSVGGSRSRGVTSAVGYPSMVAATLLALHCVE
jgi:hypothetical protein